MDSRRPRRPPRLEPALPEEEAARLEAGGDLAGLHVTGLDGDPDGAGAEVIGCRWSGVWLIGTDLERVNIIDTVFEGCDLSAAQFTSATLTRVTFSECRMASVSFADASLTDVRFEGCRMGEADFRMARSERLEAADCDLQEADFYAAALPGAQVLSCDLSGAECSKSAWAGAGLHGSTLTGLKGALALRQAVVASDQIVPLALGLFADLGITVDDDPPS